VGRVGFDWSPKGREVAWIRSYADGSQELFVVPLGGGAPRQLTHDHHNIDEVCWTRQDEILFSSNRGGNTNLWMVRATGGARVQVTKGAGPDIGMRISDDGQRLLYLQQQPVSRLWITNLVDPRPHEVPMDPVRLGTPALSADGTTIAVPVYDQDPIRPRAHLEIMNRDGSNRRRVTTGDDIVTAVQWASTGHRLLYAMTPAAGPFDSSAIMVTDAPGSDPGTAVAYGRPNGWMSDSSFIVNRAGKIYAVTLPSRHATLLTQDSVTTVPIPKRNFALVLDLRAATGGFYVRSADGSLHRFSKLDQPLVFAPRLEFALHPAGTDYDHVVRVELPSLKQTPVRGDLSSMRSGQVSIGWDSRTIVYTEPRLTAKLVLIDHLRR
jgi:dipeptidyl aminopeptidase/acylaminoacyl peptidase